MVDIWGVANNYTITLSYIYTTWGSEWIQLCKISLRSEHCYSRYLKYIFDLIWSKLMNMLIRLWIKSWVNQIKFINRSVSKFGQNDQTLKLKGSQKMTSQVSFDQVMKLAAFVALLVSSKYKIKTVTKYPLFVVKTGVYNLQVENCI